MEISVLIRNKTLIVSLTGELDHHSAKEVKDMVEEVIKNRGVKNLIFDFSDNFTRVSNCNNIRRYIFCYNTSCSDNRIVAYSYTRKNSNVTAKPHIIADVYGISP